MKKILLFGFLMISLHCFTQEIKIADNSILIANRDAPIYIENLEAGKNYLVDFGDQEQMVVSKEEFKAFHSYKTARNFVIKLFEILPNGNQKLITLKNIKINSSPQFMVIEKIELLNYSPIKSDGRAWDNSFSGTFPDVYVAFYNGDSFVEKTNKVENINRNMLPYSFPFNEIILRLAFYNKNLTVAFFDDDSVSDDDLLGGASFNTNVMTLIDSQSEGLIFESNEISFRIIYSLK